MKKLALIFLFSLVSFYGFGQKKNDAIIKNNDKKIIIAIGASFNPIKRDKYFPYTSYDKFYISELNDNKNFYKNTFGIISRFYPYLQISLLNNDSYIQSLEISLMSNTEHSEIGGRFSFSNADLKVSDYSFSYSYNKFLYPNKFKKFFKPILGIRLDSKLRCLKYNEDVDDNGGWQDSLQFNQKLWPINLGLVIGFIGIYKNLSFELKGNIAGAYFIYSHYNYIGIFHDNFPPVHREFKSSIENDFRFIFAFQPTLSLSIGYIFKTKAR
jgi:hypothetical protein